jgi:hypothetical protein
MNFKELFGYSVKYRRFLIIFSSLSIIAVFMNSMEYYPKIVQNDFGNDFHLVGSYQDHCKSGFWPFVYSECKSCERRVHDNGRGGLAIKDVYRGLLYKYDISEMIFYSAIFFGIPVIKKLW